MFRRKKKKVFVDINLSPYRKRSWTAVIAEKLSKVEKKDIALAVLSILSFISIFASQIAFNRLIEEKKGEIQILEGKIRKEKVVLNGLKRNYQTADQKFKVFYISGIKEKVFYIWYSTNFNRKVWEAVEEYRKLVGSIVPFIGFTVFPNPFFGFRPDIRPLEAYRFHRLIYSTSPVNYFRNPGGDAALNPTVYIEKFKVNPQFLRDIGKIKDSNIKANLLLQYGLIYGNIESFKVYTPVTVVFPVNLALPSEELYRSKMADLKRFCNRLIIDKEYREEIFINNSVRSKTVIDGFCIKNVY